MNDRELLEAAAKAAGLCIHLGRQRERDEAGCGHVGLWVKGATRWNPLTDDGDALRLAVQLDLLLMPYPLDRAVRVTQLDQPDTIVSWGTPPDPGAATRRAIVRAAAALAVKKVPG